MPQKFEITGPGGQRFEVTAPDGATQEQVLEYAKAQFGQPAPVPVPTAAQVAINAANKGTAAIPDAVLNTPANLANLGKVAYGMGAYALGRPDIGNAVELTPPPNLVHEQMTKAGIIDPAYEPQTAGQRLLDTGIQAATMGAIAPAQGLKQLGKNVLGTTMAGEAGQLTKEATGSETAGIVVSLLSPMALRQAAYGLGVPPKSPVLKQTIQDAMQAGFVIPPTMLKPTVVSRNLSKVGGKAAMEQQAALKNQETTNRLAASDLGLPPTEPLTPQAVMAVRVQAERVYDQVRALPGQTLPKQISSPRFSPTGKSVTKTVETPADLVQELRQARSDAHRAYLHYKSSLDPKVLTRAEKFDAKADALEERIATVAKDAGQPGLAKELQDARLLIAKTHDVERAMNPGNGNVDAHVFGKMLREKKPLTGGLALIGKFANAFKPSITREGGVGQSPGVSALEPMSSAMLAGGGYAAGGPAAALIGGGLPLLRGPARSMALAAPYQRHLVTPTPPMQDALAKGALAGQVLSSIATTKDAHNRVRNRELNRTSSAGQQRLP